MDRIFHSFPVTIYDDPYPKYYLVDICLLAIYLLLAISCSTNRGCIWQMLCFAIWSNSRIFYEGTHFDAKCAGPLETGNLKVL